MCRVGCLYSKSDVGLVMKCSKCCNPRIYSLCCLLHWVLILWLIWGFRWGATSERDHLEDLSLDGRIILKWMLQKQGEEWTGFIWLSLGKTGRLYWTQKGSLWFHKTWGISCLAEELLASQELSAVCSGLVEMQGSNSGDYECYCRIRMWHRVLW